MKQLEIAGPKARALDLGGKATEKRKKKKLRRRTLLDRWGDVFLRPRRLHDPMLVLNMSIFTYGWKRRVPLNRFDDTAVLVRSRHMA